MQKLLRLRISVICSMMIGLTALHCQAQRAGCNAAFQFQGSAEINLPSFLEQFSKQQRTSILAEVNPSAPIHLSPGTYTLDGLVNKFDPALRCKQVDGVLHVFDVKVLSSSANALNYDFAFFKMPSNVDRFRNLLAQRLEKEAFAPRKATVIQEMGGGISWDADRYPLREETYRNVQARTLIFRVASQHVLCSVISFPSFTSKSKDAEIWHSASAHWEWELGERSSSEE